LSITNTTGDASSGHRIADFDGGTRVFDIRDPYHPKDVAHYVGAVHRLPYGEQPPNMANGVLVHDLSHNNLQDSNGLIYSVDSVGYGLDILMLTPPASLVGRTQRRFG
jgi:hypothetical protein